MIKDRESIFWIRPTKDRHSIYCCTLCGFTLDVDPEEGNWELLFAHLRSEEHYYQWELERLGDG